MGCARVRAWIWPVLLGLSSPFAVRAEMSANFQVSAQVEPGCLVNASEPAANVGLLGMLDFGVHSSLSTATAQAALLRTAGIVLACTPGTPLVMRVDGGLHFDGARHLQRAPGSRLAYRIYRQTGCVDEIPVGTDIAIDTSSAPDDIAIPIHGCVVLPGNAVAGIYQDTLVVTLAW